jgi:hypothetical protein
MFMFALSLACLLSLHYVVKKMMVEKHPKDMRKLERQNTMATNTRNSDLPLSTGAISAPALGK